MMSEAKLKMKYIPAFDPEFIPAVVYNHEYLKAVREKGKIQPIAIALIRNDGLTSTYYTEISTDKNMHIENQRYIERLVKTLLWQRGGWKIIIGGSKAIGKYIKDIYRAGGLREFDAQSMERIYEKQFTVEVTEYEEVPESIESTKSIGWHFDGCRIGFDAGGSDRKAAAVIDGKVVYTEEVIWNPKVHSDPEYHYNEILTALKTASAHLPRVDAIGVSSAGIYVNNRAKIVSLFKKVPNEIFDKRITDIFLDIRKEFGGIPLEVVNDGDVTALAGAMELNDTAILGIAMGTSQAAGYIDRNGNITGWLNEMCFAPIDYNPNSEIDDWSGDYGCGVNYFSQDAVIRLALSSGIEFSENLIPSEKLKVVQELVERKDTRALNVFSDIGIYLGYGIAHYTEFYDIKHLLILGRVTSGEGGNIIIKTAEKVLEGEFPEIHKRIQIHLPDESNRRVGQSIAAASL